MARKLSELDKKVYFYILSKGEKGVPQNVLWKELGITSRDASRVLKKLEQLGYVEREPIVFNGRKTFLVKGIPKPIVEEEKKEKIIERPLINFKKYLSIPCMYCPYIDKCYVGGYYDPTTCEKLALWIEKNTSSSTTV